VQYRDVRIAFPAEEQNESLATVQNRTLMSSQNEFEASFAALGRSNSHRLPFLLEQRQPIPRNRWKRVYLGMLSKESAAI
jgi:hypothetical protein